MTLIEAVKTCFTKYATFSGRASRAEFWKFSFFVATLGLIGRNLDEQFGSYIRVGTLEFLVLTNSIKVLCFIPVAAAAARRLHDTNRSARMRFLAVVGTFASTLGAVYFGVVTPNEAFVIQLLAIALFLLPLVASSTPGPNTYGPNPHEVTP